MIDHGFEPDAGTAIGEEPRRAAADRPRIGVHPGQIGPDVRREVRLVDHEQVAQDEARSPLARDLVAAGDVDDVQAVVDELGAERQGQVVAAALEQDVVGRREPFLELRQHRQVHRGVLANRSVRTGARLDAGDPRAIQDAVQRSTDVLLVLAGDDVVGHDDHRSAGGDEERHEALDQGRLAGADRSADPNPEWSIGHEANNRPVAVS